MAEFALVRDNEVIVSSWNPETFASVIKQLSGVSVSFPQEPCAVQVGEFRTLPIDPPTAPTVGYDEVWDGAYTCTVVNDMVVATPVTSKLDLPNMQSKVIDTINAVLGAAELTAMRQLHVFISQTPPDAQSVTDMSLQISEIRTSRQQLTDAALAAKSVAELMYIYESLPTT